MQNQGRHRVGLPVSKIKELEFNAQDGTVRPKEIDKQKLFAFFNFYLKPIDTKGTQVEPWPHPIVGLALSKKPLDRIFVGGGWGLNKIDFFAGVAFNKTQSPATLPQGAAATQSQLESDLKTKYQAKFVVGLNVPVRQILDKLKAK